MMELEQMELIHLELPIGSILIWELDFSEWYFICATYNPVVNEQGSTPTVQNADFWRNNIVNGTSTYIAASGFGNRSKVEIISRTDLLRARGYKSS